MENFGGHAGICVREGRGFEGLSRRLKKRILLNYGMESVATQQGALQSLRAAKPPVCWNGDARKPEQEAFATVAQYYVFPGGAPHPLG